MLVIYPVCLVYFHLIRCPTPGLFLSLLQKFLQCTQHHQLQINVQIFNLFRHEEIHEKRKWEEINMFSCCVINHSTEETHEVNTPHRRGSLDVSTALKFYLCSTALLRRSFSVFSKAASGLTWEIFSSSVPLMLDAWLAEGVSRPDSW